MNKDLLLSQLAALRLQLGALSAQVEALFNMASAAPEAPAASPVCQHPLAARQSFRTMGNPDVWRCRQCGYEHGTETLQTAEALCAVLQDRDNTNP